MKSKSRRHLYVERRTEDDYVLKFDWNSIEDAKRCILWNGEWEDDTCRTVDFLDQNGILPSEGTVCDFGVGVGRITSEILRRRRTVSVVGVDRSLSMLSHAEQYLNTTLRSRYRGIDLPSFMKSHRNFAQAFRSILMIETLQHIPEMEIDQLLPIINTTLSSGGVLFVLGNELLDAPSKRFGNSGRRQVADVLRRYCRVARSGVLKDLATERFWFECHAHSHITEVNVQCISPARD